MASLESKMGLRLLLFLVNWYMKHGFSEKQAADKAMSTVLSILSK